MQALTLLNSKLTLDWAQSFAGKVIAVAGWDQERQIEAAFRLAYSRLPEAGEMEMVRAFFRRQEGILAERLSNREKLAMPANVPEKEDKVEAAALVDLCHILINANEFVYRN